MKSTEINTEKKFLTALEAAAAYLMGMGIIKKDLDVCDATGAEKGNFSAMKNGKAALSKNFVVKFEEAFNLNLKDFNPEFYDPVKYMLGRYGTTQAAENHLVTLFNEVQSSFDKLKKAALLPVVSDTEVENPFVDLGQSVNKKYSEDKGKLRKGSHSQKDR